MKKLILICGDLAAGKSTFSNMLSEKFNIVCFNKDNIKEILGDNFGFKNREENFKLSVCTFDIFKYICEKEMIAQKDMIFESNFRTHEMEYLDTLAHKYNYEILTIVINADINVLHQRFMNRINNENRHAVHKAVDLSDINVFNKQILDDRDRKYYGKVLKLDSTNFDNIYNDKVITLVRKFIKE